MVFFAVLLSLAGVALFAWTVMRLASIALPVWLGVSTFVWCARGGAGPLIGALLGLAVAVLALFAARLVARSRLPIALRSAVLLLFAVPAALAGYSVASGFMTLSGAGSVVAGIVGGLGALATFIAAIRGLVRQPG